MTAAAWGERPPWLVQIRPKKDAAPKGAGVFCAEIRGEGYVVTCAHVISKPAPATAPEELVYVWFEFCGEHDPIPAEVVPEGWEPDPDDDVAVLRLKAAPPPAAVAAPLHSTERGVAGHSVIAHGYPEGRNHARPFEGSAVAATGGRRLEVRTRTTMGRALERGFSGTPVWDQDQQGVIGIVVTRELPRKVDDRIGYVDPRVGDVVPAEELARHWDPLRPFVHVLGTAAERRHAEERKQAEERKRAEERERLRACTALLSPEGELPAVHDARIYDLGIKPSKYVAPDNPSPPYVPRRRIDRELDEALAASPFVLALGDSAAGKSRSMIEMLRRTMPRARLIVPADDPTAPAQLAELSLPVDERGGVLWLDDLGRFLKPGGLDLAALDHFARHDPPIKIVATMTLAQKAAVEASGEVGRTAMTVLGRAHEIRIGSRLDEEDRDQARALYPQEDFGVRGIGEQLVGAHKLEARYRGGREDNPPGWAVLQVAVDWRRMGLEAPIPDTSLRVLFPGYLDTVRPNADYDRAFPDGVRWATQPIVGSVVPMRRVSTPAGIGYRAFDYLVELAGGHRDPADAVPIPESSWYHAIEAAPAADLLGVVFTAMSHSLADVGRAAATRAREHAETAEVRAWATLLLGGLEAHLGNIDAAQRLLTEAAESGAGGVATPAQVELAALLINRGDAARAGELLEAALASGDSRVELLAKANLGVVRIRQGDAAAAQELLEEVLSSVSDNQVTTDDQATTLAEAHLGGLLVSRASRADAQLLAKTTVSPGTMPDRADRPSMFQALVESGSAVALPLAQTALGGLLLSEGDPQRARQLLESALGSGDPRVVPVAQASLGALAIDEGDLGTARQLLETALASGHPDAAAWARINLAGLAYHEGDAERARTGLEQVAGGGHAEYAPMAADLLGDLLAGAGDADGARAAYQRAIDTGHRDWAPMARIDLALLFARGDSAIAVDEAGWAARRLLEDVAGGTHPHLAPRAADLLGDLLAAQRDVEGARAAYQRAIEFDHPQWTPIAQTDLAVLLAGRGDGEGAREAYQRAKDEYQRVIDSGHPQWTPIAQIGLAALTADTDSVLAGTVPDGTDPDGTDPARADLAGAARLASAATQAADPRVATQAHLVLGTILLEQGEPAAARTHLTTAADSEFTEIATSAQVQLARLAADVGELDDAVAFLDTLRSQVGGVAPVSAHKVGGPVGVARRRRPAESEGSEGSAELPVGQAYLDHCDYLFDMGNSADLEKLLHALALGPLAMREPELVPAAQARLGRLRLVQGHLDEARELLQRALDTGGSSVEPMARRFLGSVLARQHEYGAARAVLRPLVESTDREHRAGGLHVLGRVAAREGNRAEGREWLRQAVAEAMATSDADTAEQAQKDLDTLAFPGGTREIEQPPAEALPAELSRAELPPAQVVPGEQSPAQAPPDTRFGNALPPRVLALLAEIAWAEGADDEAREWEELSRARP